MTTDKSPDRPSQPAGCVMCSSASSRPRTCRRSPRLARPVRVDQGGHPGNGEDGPSLSGREGKSRNELLPSGEPVAHPLLTYTCLTVTDFGGQLDADMTRQNGHDLRPRATEGGGSWPKESRHGRREGTVPSVCRSRKRTICGSSMIPRRFGAPLMIVSVRPLSCSR